MSTITQYDKVTVFQSELYMTNSIALNHPELLLVVDPCWLPSEVETIRRLVRERSAGRLPYLLYTHSDYDHIIGDGAFPGAVKIGNERLLSKPDIEKEAILEQIRKFDDDYYLVRGYPITYPELDVAAATDGQQLTIGDSTLTFYTSPGHNDDGIFTVIEPGGILIAGDYLSDIEFPYIYHSSEDYLHTLDKAEMILERHDIALIIPGHGSPTSDRAEMLQRIGASRSYIHRLREVVQAADNAGFHELVAGCRFPRNMRSFHEANRKLVENEMR